MILNKVRQHSCFIIQGSYIGYMFRLIDQSQGAVYTLGSQCVYIN